MPLLRSRVLSATASLAAAVLLATTVAATPASAASDDDGSGIQGIGVRDSAFSTPPPAPSQNAASQAAPSRSAGAGTPEPAAVDRFIVKFTDDAGRRAAERANAYQGPAEELSTEVQEVRSTAAGARVVTTDRELDAAEAADLVAELETDPAIEYAEPDLILKPAAANPNDTHYGYQWNFTDPDAGSQAFAGMNVPAAWDVSRGEGVVVAVVDTGITSHGDLDANVLPGYDMISQSGVSGDDIVNPRDGDGRDADPSDEGDWYAQDECGAGTGSSASSWHGTHVAGTIAAVTGNGLGIAGVAPEARIVPVRALGSCGGYASDISDAIVWAAGGTVRDEGNNPLPANAHRAHVINLSLGGYGECSATLQGAVDAAVAAGSVVVAAAGNESMDVQYSTPANCGHVVAVAASGPDGSLAGYSNFGESIDVTAPGGTFDAGAAGGILSTTNAGETVPQDQNEDEDDLYSYAEGTSSAAPHVSGVVALLLAARPSMTPAEVEARLEETARPLSGACAEGCGAGLVNAAAALGPAPGGEPAVVAGTPTIDDGTPAVGQMLTAQAGNGWSPSGLTFAYQWKRGGTAIPAATGSTYTPTPEDLAAALSVTVTGHAAGTPGAFASATSAATAAVAEGTLAGPTPTIGGTRKVGATLRASAGTWTTGTTLAYQWYRSGTAISGATKSAYGLSGADAGRRITVKVTGTKTGYTTLSRTSAATTAIAQGTLRTGTPTISGTPKVGSRLTAKAGTWTTGTRLTYQWYRSGAKIKGATKSAYRLVAADRKDTIKVRVTGTKTGYTTVRKYSKATARIR